MDPALNALLGQFRVLLITVGSALSTHGFITPSGYAQYEQGVGVLLVILPAVWAFYNSFVNYKKATAQGVQAGINLVRSGATVDHDGNPMDFVGPDSSPPKPITVASAQQIIKDYAPPAAEISKT